MTASCILSTKYFLQVLCTITVELFTVAGDLKLLKEQLDDPSRPTNLLSGTDQDDLEVPLAAEQYLSHTREWKPPLEVYEPGSGVAIIVGVLLDVHNVLLFAIRCRRYCHTAPILGCCVM